MQAEAQLFLDLVWRAAIEATSQDYNKLLATRRETPAALLRKSTCVLVTACHPPKMESREPLITLVRAVQAELHRTRCANATSSKTGVVQLNIEALLLMTTSVDLRVPRLVFCGCPHGNCELLHVTGAVDQEMGVGR